MAKYGIARTGYRLSNQFQQFQLPVCIASDQIQLSRVIECDQRKQTTGLQNILKVFLDVLQKLIVDMDYFLLSP